jgi:hypothetical protein
MDEEEVVTEFGEVRLRSIVRVVEETQITFEVEGPGPARTLGCLR